VLWDHVFQVVVCVLNAPQRGRRTLHGIQYTHHMLPQHCITYNTVSLLIISTEV